MELLTKIISNRKIVLISAGIGLGCLLLLAVLLSLLLKPSPPAQAQESTAEETAAPTIFPPNPYGPNDFQFDGDYLTCLTGESLLGVDVSSLQGQIDWEQVRSAGVEFVMIRVGGRGYGQEGKLYTDDSAQQNYADAKAAGLLVGAYFFSQATSINEAQEEAAFALEQMSGWELDLPLAFDWEYIDSTARTANVDPQTLTDCALAFCSAVESAGHQAMLYTNPHHFENRLDAQALTQYPVWLAMYSYRMTFPHRIHMWQYTAEGRVPGINEIVDLNLFFPFPEDIAPE